MQKPQKHRYDFEFDLPDGVPAKRRSPNLSDAGLKPGDVITYCFDESITATVKSARSIIFEGNTTTLKAAALTVLNREGFMQQSVNGWYYWSADGELLAWKLEKWWMNIAEAI